LKSAILTFPNRITCSRSQHGSRSQELKKRGGNHIRTSSKGFQEETAKAAINGSKDQFVTGKIKKNSSENCNKNTGLVRLMREVLKKF